MSRDQPDQRLYLTRNEDTLIWQLDHAECELWKEPPDPLLEKVASLLTDSSPLWEGRASELAIILQEDTPPNLLVRRLNIGKGKLAELYQVKYTSKRNKAGSLIRLYRTTG